MRFSLEFYPAISERGHQKLKETISLYAKEVQPRFVSLTCGAGGASIDPERDRRALETIAHMRQEKLQVAAHLPHCGRSRSQAMELLKAFREAGANMVLALRGDISDDEGYRLHPEGFEHTADFISEIKNCYPDMPVLAAGYPEMHPYSPTPEYDMANLKRKIDAGASAILGQFCFDADIVSKWQKKCLEQAPDTAVVPGIIALLNYERVCERALRSHVRVPETIHTTFRDLKQGTVTYDGAVLDIMTRQLDGLVEVGFDHVLVYALNSPKFVNLLARLNR